MLEAVEDLLETELDPGEHLTLASSDRVPAHRAADKRKNRDSRREDQREVRDDQPETKQRTADGADRRDRATAAQSLAAAGS